MLQADADKGVLGFVPAVGAVHVAVEAGGVLGVAGDGGDGFAVLACAAGLGGQSGAGGVAGDVSTQARTEQVAGLEP